jgi:hypothetical protein
VHRRDWILSLLALVPLAADESPMTIRGRLSKNSAGKPILVLSGGKQVVLEGDESTTGVINDKRLDGMDLEVIGRFRATDTFVINPIHTKAMFVHKDGKRLYITYWCDVCSIRTYTPGKCVCCQEETDLDLRERFE